MAKKVTTPKPIETAITAYQIPDVTIKAIKEFQKAEKLVCKDTKSRQIIGKHRADIKSLISKIETKRKDNNRDYQTKNNDHAVLIKDALSKSRDIFDGKIKDYDKIADDKRKKKELEKKKADGLIRYHMDGLKVDCEAGQEYNLTSAEILVHIDILQLVELSVIDFGDKTEDAEVMLRDALENTMNKYDARLEFEKEQAEQVRIKEEQEAKAKELEEKEAELKEEQDERDRVAKEAKAKVDKKAEEDAKELRLANEKLENGRKALEKEKSDIAAKNKADEEAKHKEADRKIEVEKLFEEMFYSSDPEDDKMTYYELCRRYNMSDELILKDKLSEYRKAILEELGIMKDQAYDAAVIQEKEEVKKRKARLKKDKQYAKDIKVDKKTLSGMLIVVDKSISKFNPADGEYKTNEAAQIETSLIVKIKEAIEIAQASCDNL